MKHVRTISIKPADAKLNIIDIPTTTLIDLLISLLQAFRPIFESKTAQP